MLSVELSPPGGWLVASGFTAAATPTFWPASATPQRDALISMAEPSAAVAQNLSDVRIDSPSPLAPGYMGVEVRMRQDRPAHDWAGRRHRVADREDFSAQAKALPVWY